MKYFSFGGSFNAVLFIFSCDFTEHGTYYCTKIKIHIYIYIYIYIRLIISQLRLFLMSNQNHMHNHFRVWYPELHDE